MLPNIALYMAVTLFTVYSAYFCQPLVEKNSVPKRKVKRARRSIKRIGSDFLQYQLEGFSWTLCPYYCSFFWFFS